VEVVLPKLRPYAVFEGEKEGSVKIL